MNSISVYKPLKDPKGSTQLLQGGGQLVDETIENEP